MNEHRAGEPAPVTRTRWWLPPREEIGAPDCPFMYRWVLLDRGAWKVLLHRFVPDAIDVDCHDHPRGFVTFVLWGSYVDITPERHFDALLPGSVRYRPAEHAHKTHAGPRGCWTLVIMGPKRRDWGFWRGGWWWQWRDYEREFGMAMRCDTDEAKP